MDTSLGRGDLLPEVLIAPPGPESRRLCTRLEDVEAPIVNTVSAAGPAVVWAEALGANVLDVDGNRYIDLTSGFGAAAVGHRHPRVVEAVNRQAAKLLHGLGDIAAHPTRVALATSLKKLAPITDARIFFATSGSDAVEIALKSAMLATGRSGVLVFEPAYHGLSFGALALSSRASFRLPFEDVLNPAIARLPFGCDTELLASALSGGRERLACVVFEPIVGREGVLLPPTGWLEALQRICQAEGILLVADEIFTGFGRTGQTFAIEEEGIEVDLLCCGKALAGGLPLASVIGRREVMAAWDRPGEALHTGTFMAHPLSCAAALEVLGLLEEENLLEKARRGGQKIEKRLSPWVGAAGVTDLRGRGLLWGLEMDRASRAKALASEALAEGLIILAGGSDGRTLQILPPLTIDSRQLDAALDILEHLLSSSEASG